MTSVHLLPSSPVPSTHHSAISTWCLHMLMTNVHLTYCCVCPCWWQTYIWHIAVSAHTDDKCTFDILLCLPMLMTNAHLTHYFVQVHWMVLTVANSSWLHVKIGTLPKLRCQTNSSVHDTGRLWWLSSFFFFLKTNCQVHHCDVLIHMACTIVYNNAHFHTHSNF